MKICVLCVNFRNFGSGHDRAIHDIVAGLSARAEVTVFAAAIDRSARLEKVRFRRLPALPFNRFLLKFFSLRLSWWVYRRFGGTRGYDLVYASSPLFGGADVVMVTFHSTTWREQLRNQHRSGLLAKLKRRYQLCMHGTSAWLEARTLARAERDRRPLLLPSSEALAEDLRHRHGLKQARIVTMPHPIDVERFRPAPTGTPRRQVPALTGWPPESFVAVFLGSGWERKGLADAIEALGSTPPSVRLLVLGKGDAEHYRTLARAQGVNERVHFAGLRRDVDVLLREADALVLPSSFDTLAVACLEGLASGLPLLIYPFHGADTLVGDNRRGFVVRTPVELGERLTWLASEPKALAEMKRKARAGAEQFSLTKTSERLMALFSAVDAR